MRVILTHEQTDFDAIASMLGAYLLQDNTHAILPKTLNRNVRKFLQLFSMDLPFIQLDELQKKNITIITLVDTQSLVTIKGINKNTQVFVIDHHKKKPNFPPKWNFIKVNTSACTTYFVEKIIEKNSCRLSIIEATLLLLGIYEDTGTLTYPSTTARDASAVAFLLSQGASLKIATEFLNPPLSLDQRKVFEVLMKNSQVTNIDGNNIFITNAKESAGFVE